ncbi:hypothetical protein AXK11_00240 [Cephaloticoccus primus]|uniref:Uncharacterized protein n=1 Tax=Cephaloticoccus primus TaxID=1548207 RepID=A0A139ST04_9BACT|nr:hypothetical protein [Cephaloticoccus primus]KXU37699.1 hypothetical protein AXK11_00240 [Cephaloticoccus primus]
MDYFRFIVTLIGAAVLGWFGISTMRDHPVDAPSLFSNEGLPPEARSEIGGSTLYRADAARGVIPTADPSIRIGG